MTLTKLAYRFSLSTLSVLIAACGGGGGGNHDDPPKPTFTIGGTLTGLSQGQSLSVQNNGADRLTLTTPGKFTFATAIAQGSVYSVTVEAQPSGQSCTISNGSGTVVNAVTNVDILCRSTIDPNAINTLSPSHKPVMTGAFVLPVVANLRYSSTTQTGATSPTGEFAYRLGELLQFKIGGVSLPPVAAHPSVIISDFASATSSWAVAAPLLNVANFLQSLDSDGDPANGITISDATHSALSNASLDFTQTAQDFSIAANPLIVSAHSAGGTPNTSLLATGVVAQDINNASSVLLAGYPINGSWFRGDRATFQAFTLFDNGTYYFMSASCNGIPDFEQGTWHFDSTSQSLALSVTNNHDGTGCGFNSSTLPVQNLVAAAVAVPNGIALVRKATIGGSQWTSMPSPSSSYIGGVFVSGNILDANNARLWVLDSTQGNYLLLDICDDTHFAESGTFSWSAATNILQATTLAATTNNNTCRLSAANSALTDGKTLTVIAGTNQSSIEMYQPAFNRGSLLGAWATPTNAGGALVFTGDARVFYSEKCGGKSTREHGTFIWDSITGSAAIDVTSDGNGLCGLAELLASRNASVTRLAVTGNVLTITSDEGTVAVTKLYENAISQAGVWQSTTNPKLVVGISSTTPSTNQNAYVQELFAIGSDCGIETEDETIEFTLTGHLMSGVSQKYDTPNCGLTPALGPTFNLLGDTLNIQGLGEFVRLR